MKTRHLLLSALTMALTLPVLAQSHDDKALTAAKGIEPTEPLGNPALNAAVEGLSVKVWLTTEKQQDMTATRDLTIGQMEVRGIKESGAVTSTLTKERKTTDSHFIVLSVTDSANGNEIAITNAKVMIVFPSNKSLAVDLEPLVSYGLALEEKGEYHFTVSFRVDGSSRIKGFTYAVL